MRLEFHPDARSEFKSEVEYYAAQRRDLGIRFTDAVEDTIRRILQNPGRGRIVERNVRRCLTPVFSHAIHYIVTADTVFIVAVGHCSREPGYWKTRLGQ